MKIKNRDQFNELPQELTTEILSRLPVRTIIKSKCVCKSWRSLVISPHFASLHSRHVAMSSCRLPIIQDLKFANTAHPILGFIEDNEVIQDSYDGLVFYHKRPNLKTPYIYSSVNGLLFMLDSNDASELAICNPITREYVKIEMGHECDSREYAFGFGKSKSGQYKVVNIHKTCQVYTLGTGQWKSIPIGTQFGHDWHSGAVFVNENLHWLHITTKHPSPWVSSMDLETEVFTSFSCPCRLQQQWYKYNSLSALGDSLCFTGDTFDDEVEIWCMKEYGNDKSWTKDYVIKRPPYKICGWLYPTKPFNGGILLMSGRFTRLFYYSDATKTIEEITIQGVTKGWKFYNSNLNL